MTNTINPPGAPKWADADHTGTDVDAHGATTAVFWRSAPRTILGTDVQLVRADDIRDGGWVNGKTMVRRGDCEFTPEDAEDAGEALTELAMWGVVSNYSEMTCTAWCVLPIGHLEDGEYDRIDEHHSVRCLGPEFRFGFDIPGRMVVAFDDRDQPETPPRKFLMIGIDGPDSKRSLVTTDWARMASPELAVAAAVLDATIVV